MGEETLIYSIFHHYSKLMEYCTLKIKLRFYLHEKFISYGRALILPHLPQKGVTTYLALS